MAEILTEQIEALKTKQNNMSGQSMDFPTSHATNKPEKPGKNDEKSRETDQKLPKGVVLDKDGKPCRTCTSLADWRALTRMKSSSTASSSTTNATSTTAPTTTSSAAATEASLPADCPADVEALGRSTWTLLHTMAATYPTKASGEQQRDMQSFLSTFSKLYPCWSCADDFRAWMSEPSGRNRPRLGGRSEFGNWMCEAHNEVNRKLGKKEFDCFKWEERWRTGWKDGRCD